MEVNILFDKKEGFIKFSMGEINILINDLEKINKKEKIESLNELKGCLIFCRAWIKDSILDH